MSNTGTEFSVDISTLLRVLRKYAVIVAVFTIIGTVAAFTLAEFVLPKKYSAYSKFYIENSKNQSEILNVGDINAARSMVNTCAELFSTRDITQRLKEKTGAGYDVDEMMDMISMGTSNNTEFLVVTVTAENSETAVFLLENFIGICTEEFENTIGSGKIRTVDSPYSTGKPVFPNTKIFAAIGFFAGFVLSYLVVFLVDVLDTKVKFDDDLYTIYGIPVFAEIMSFDAKTKGESGDGQG